MQVRIGLAENDESPWEWGLYFERNDNGNWTTLVCGGYTYKDAYKAWRSVSHSATAHPNHYRNARLVRRAVSPWEVRDHE